ncbi:coiled-coil domain-containing protein 15-like [Haliotis rufescens]|uniref:coiled-coil domain-containing protein 15-like n=1 Tax=Haliotis rufescens TaxID=6454 RepID=UPI00201ED3DE|nr:coiled-coil domain-containing protein 15-like [Haliotis rufescens]XP_048241000.1 coiled-coil domain-containing protein 15-like [Haliotis rufescens]
MAAKTKTFASAGMKGMMKPVISTDVMGNRNVEIRPVGAWVQPATEQMINSHPNAIEAAVEEENRMFQMQREKEDRLRRFQDEVKRRVRHLDRLKKQQQAQMVVNAIERERLIVRQSTLSAQRQSTRKDSCTVRTHPGLSIRSRAAPNTQGGWANSQPSSHTQAFSDQTNQVHEFTSEARRKLGGRQILTDNFIRDDLPGGVWRVSHTRDHPSSRHTVEGDVLDLDSDNSSAEDTEDRDDVDEEKYTHDENEEESENRWRRQMKTVHFDLSPPRTETRHERIQRRSVPTMTGTDLQRPAPVIPVPDIYTGVTMEENRRRQRSQTALYRRMFMDQEREQVKENLRRQEHRKRIQKLKQDKEEARQEEEEQALRLVQPRDPVTGETSDEAILRDQLEQSHIRDTLQQHQHTRRRHKEMERYVEALRHNLREKIVKRGVQLPPLCCCGDSLWDTNPDTCANNCFFYKNPKAYAKALQSLLVSCEVV